MRVTGAQGQEFAHGVLQGAVRVRPVQPGRLVVLAIGVVVAALRLPELVARERHRRTVAEGQRGEHGGFARAAGGLQRRVRTFRAHIVGQVVPVAVAVVLAVRVVVLVVVAYRVVQGEAVMGGQEVHAGPRRPTLETRRTAQHVPGKVAVCAAVPAPEGARRVAVFVVPLRPPVREVAKLVAMGSDVPRLGDQLDGGQDGVGLDRFQQRCVRVEAASHAAQCGGEVEAETVHAVMRHPMAQAVQREVAHRLAPHVEHVARAGVVDVAAAVALQRVIAGIVDAAKAQGRAEAITLRRVVVHDVEDELEPRRVQRAHRVLQPGFAAGSEIGRVRGEIVERVVAPVVGEAHRGQARLGVEGLQRQELQRGDAEPRNVGGNVRQGLDRAAQDFGDVGVAHGQALGVGFVDDSVGPGRVRPLPLRRGHVFHDDAARHVRRAVGVVEGGVVLAEMAVEGGVLGNRARQPPGIGVDEELVGVEAVALLGRPRAVHAVAVELARPHARDVHVPHIAVA